MLGRETVGSASTGGGGANGSVRGCGEGGSRCGCGEGVGKKVAATIWKGRRRRVAGPNHTPPLRYPARHLGVVASASPKGAEASEAARERRRFLERYGLNLDDFEEDVEPDPREDRRREMRMRWSGRGEEEAAVSPARSVERRETHKMLQVLAGKVRRRKLLSPKDRNVRPMMEVVRGAAFDIIVVDRKAHSYDVIHGNDHTYMHSVHDK
ncbi:uncharacterized protein [Triticum aestivum]|uniref:uncharacterized protein n=1 Tax=Triticum aestivum TaxID=4565 RepID=UPI001D029D58|nr:uncharacterized protein LOC123067184 [Triticum aestivum]